MDVNHPNIEAGKRTPHTLVLLCIRLVSALLEFIIAGIWYDKASSHSQISFLIDTGLLLLQYPILPREKPYTRNILI